MVLTGWAAERLASHAYLQPWEPAWPEDDLTKAAFRRRLSIYAREMELGNAWPFFVFVQDGKTLAGAVTLSNVRRGVAETGTLGYWIGKPFAGRGHATAAVCAMVDYAFEELKLHEIAKVLELTESRVSQIRSCKERFSSSKAAMM